MPAGADTRVDHDQACSAWENGQLASASTASLSVWYKTTTLSGAVPTARTTPYIAVDTDWPGNKRPADRLRSAVEPPLTSLVGTVMLSTSGVTTSATEAICGRLAPRAQLATDGYGGTAGLPVRAPMR